MPSEPLLLIISSPSGAGKTTLTRDLLHAFPALGFSVSHTTRPPRRRERDGTDYHFVRREQFERIAREGGFAEWAEVHGNLYGTSLEEIERCARDGKQGIVFDIDYQGARQLRASRPDAIMVFVLPPSLSVLKERLEQRGQDDEMTIERRYASAKREIEHYALADYLVVNDDLELAKMQLRSIVHAECCRRQRLAARAERLLRHGALEE